MKKKKNKLNKKKNQKNLENLNKQIQLREQKNKLNKKMSPTEFAMNKNTLMKAKVVNNQPELA